MRPVSNCRAVGLERLSHIQTNGPIEPPSICFFIHKWNSLDLVAAIERSVIIYPIESYWVRINSGHRTKRKGRSRCLCTMLLFLLSQYGVALGKLPGGQKITSSVCESYTYHAEIHLQKISNSCAWLKTPEYGKALRETDQYLFLTSCVATPTLSCLSGKASVSKNTSLHSWYSPGAAGENSAHPPASFLLLCVI